MSTANLNVMASNRVDLRILLILSALMAFTSISTDLYLPAMPSMGEALHTSVGAIELTITGYLVGFSLGQLLWGPIGDKYGRRKPVAIGLILFVVGSAGCALSTTVESMIAWRILQAAGACASVVLARAMVRDLYSGHRAAQMMSTLMTVMAVAPLIGPSVGGLILRFASWRVIFLVLVVVGLATLAALRLLPETLPTSRRPKESLGYALRGYGELITHRRLLGYAGTSGFFYGGVYAYIAGTPFAFISYHHVAPQLYGVLFAVGIVGIMGANQINARLVTRIGSDRLMRMGAWGAAISGVWLALDAWTDMGGLLGLMLPLFVFVSAAGFIVANSIAGALDAVPHRAGAVSALIGATQYGTGILGSMAVGAFSSGTPAPMGAVIAVAGIASLLCAYGFVPAADLTRIDTSNS
ncbi:MFS transporter [Burkholderia diffusa]|uniref:Bcr/CflA family efflux transporter n=1 Tax=Burkholderia diffusa TaxID=488732 RepID=A0AAW3PB65_9BURK|nr:multidrug effflux MFS transporter [Burkholderia diffusa]KWF32742.1 MFS transporter [Burkholderia diffusa]KWF38668.1 MFS transporter [Burkholderia diffusa]KWF46713.1 MFS transporter [Burkholderia diffusa]KWF50715.1 MFS transporter [Burkholderia diffusa]